MEQEDFGTAAAEIAPNTQNRNGIRRGKPSVFYTKDKATTDGL